MVEVGYPWYGQKIGVLVFNSKSPRIVGDPGHARSFTYQVSYYAASGSFSQLVEGSLEIKESLVSGVTALKERGACGVVGDCGLMSLYQGEIPKDTGVLFVGSALCLIPTIWQLLGRSGTIGIITGHSEYLRPHHLEQSGWTQEIPVSIIGMENKAHFKEIVLGCGSGLCYDKMKNEVLEAAAELKKSCPTIRAIIIECSNLATYSAYVAQHTSLPVFDIMVAANLLSSGISPKEYNK